MKESIKYMIGCLFPLILFRLLAMFYTNILNYNLVESHLFITFLLCNAFAYSMAYLIFDETHPYETIIRIRESSKKDIIDLLICCFPCMILGNFLYLVSSPLEISLFAGTSIFFNTLSSILINKNKYLLNWKIILLLICNIGSCILPTIYKSIYEKHSVISIKGIISNLTLLIISGYMSAKLENVHGSSSILDFKGSKFSSVVFSISLIEMFYMLLFTPSILLTGKYLGIEFPEWSNFISIYAFGCIMGFIFAFLFIIYDYCIFKLKSVEVGINENINLVILSLLAVVFGFDKFDKILIISLSITILSSILLTIVISREEEKYKARKIPTNIIKVQSSSEFI